MTVQKAGFVMLEGAASPDATLMLVRGGAIEGTVADVAGDPIWNAVVTALEPRPNGKPQAVARVRTDDLGRYRLYSLPAGNYYVEAATDQAYLLRLLLMAGETRPPATRMFYPAASTLEDAKPVRVAFGLDITSVDLVLTPGAPLKSSAALPPPRHPEATGTARIAGRVVEATSGKPIRNARLQLSPLEGSRFSILMRTDAQGRFAYAPLEARRYTLSAEAERFVTLEFGQKRAGETGTQIQLRDGEDFTADFALPRASALEGTVVDEFGDPAPNVMIRLARKQYAAGRQRLMPVNVASPRWTLRKIMYNELDVTDSPVDFRTKDVEGVEVVLSSKVTRIIGGVSDDKGPVTDYALVFFSSDPTKWIDRSRFVMMGRA